MKKYMKYIIVIIVGLFIIFFSIGLYVGNYIYDYTLNPYSDHSLFDFVEKDEESSLQDEEWLNQHSQSLYLKSEDNLSLHSYYIKQKSHTYIIMVHGYRGDGPSIISPIKNMYKEGYNLLIPELRGHGQSEGNYIGMGIDDRKDILKWIEYIIEKDKNASIVLYGVSMGGATVMNVAGEKLPKQVKAIIEDCGYTSVLDIFKTHIDTSKLENRIALYMTNIVTQIRAGYNLKEVEPILQIQKSQIPILFIHGEQDDFVPFDMMNQLYEVASCPKEKLIIKEANHANSCSVDSQLYYRTIHEFIQKYNKNQYT